MHTPKWDDTSNIGPIKSHDNRPIHGHFNKKGVSTRASKDPVCYGASFRFMERISDKGR